MAYKKIKLPNYFSQYDSRWASDLLGFNTASNFNIYNFGCLITCLSMASNYYGYSIDPKKMNEKLKSLGADVGFARGGGLYVWGALSKIYSSITEKKVSTPAKLTDEQMNEIKQAINEGYPVMLQLDYNPKTVEFDMHYVLGIGYNPDDENDMLIVDPLGGVEKSLKSYLGWYKPSARNTIEQYIVLKGKVPTTTSIKDTEIDFNDSEGKRKTVGWYVYEWFVEKTSRVKENQVATKEIIELREQIVTINKKLDTTFELVTEKEGIITKKEEKIIELNKTITAKDEEIKILKSQALENYTVGGLLVLIWEKVKDIKLK